MKFVIGILILTLAGVSAQAQQEAKIVAELAASAERIVKDSPFSAEAVSESVQTLADGNRIVRSSTSKLYRNSEGRFRREIASGSGAVMGSLYTTGAGITILDPVVGQRYLLNSTLRTAYLAALKPTGELKVAGVLAAAPSAAALKENAVVLDKLRGELKVSAPMAALSPSLTTTVAGVPLTGGAVAAYSSEPAALYESRSENLGKRSMEGVEAEGTRTTTTIPAGAIGNERPIEITYERWYSDDLHMVVMSKHNDPRFGEQTYRLTNVVRAEPDPSLFSLPTGYRLITDTAPAYSVEIDRKIEIERATAAGRNVPSRATTTPPATSPKP